MLTATAFGLVGTIPGALIGAGAVSLLPLHRLGDAALPLAVLIFIVAAGLGAGAVGALVWRRSGRTAEAG